METNAVTALTDHYRRFLEAVKAACCLERRWGLLAGPMALLTLVRSRRARREAAEGLAAALDALMQGIVLVLEEFRAGRLVAPVAEAPVQAVDGCAGAREGIAAWRPSLVRLREGGGQESANGREGPGQGDEGSMREGAGSPPCQERGADADVATAASARAEAHPPPRLSPSRGRLSWT